MMKRKIDIFTHHYFPYYMIILGIVLTPLIAIPVYTLLSIGAAIVSFLLLSTHFRLQIDPAQKSYRVYLWIVGFRNGKDEKYEHIEYLYINKIYKETEYGLVARLSFGREVYVGFIKLNDGTTLYIGESSNERKMRMKTEKLSSELGVEIKQNY